MQIEAQELIYIPDVSMDTEMSYYPLLPVRVKKQISSPIKQKQILAGDSQRNVVCRYAVFCQHNALGVGKLNFLKQSLIFTFLPVLKTHYGLIPHEFMLSDWPSKTFESHTHTHTHAHTHPFFPGNWEEMFIGSFAACNIL